MDVKIAVGCIVGAVAAVGSWVWSTDFFNRLQKILITLSFLFPPASLALIVLISLYNKFLKPKLSSGSGSVNSTNSLHQADKIRESIEKIEALHKSGVFNDEELKQKRFQLEDNLKIAENIEKREKVRKEIELTDEYKMLVGLKSDDVINDTELEIKVNQLIDRLAELTDEIDYQDEYYHDEVYPISTLIGWLVIIALLIFIIVVGIAESSK